MRNFFVGLLLAAFLPFIMGFGDVPPDKNLDKNIAQGADKKNHSLPSESAVLRPHGEPQGAPYPCHLSPSQPSR